MDNNFGTNFGSSDFNSPIKTSNRFKNKKVGCGCGSILLIIIFILLYFFAYHLIFPSLFPKWVRGDLQGVIIFPGKDGKNKLWIQNDGSFSYIQETKSSGSYSVGRKGLFCKTFTYVYDPVTKDVLEGFKTDYDFLPQNPEMLYTDGKIWCIESLNGPASIRVYDPDTYRETLNTESFCAKSKELSAGLEKIYVDYSLPLRFTLTAKDGRQSLYCPSDDKFFSDYSEMQKFYSQDSSQSSMFMLDREANSDKRKKLYFITGPKAELYFSSPRPESIIEHKGRKDEKLNAEMMAKDKAYIEGELLYSDNEIAVIVHQDNIGKNANRMLSCVDKSGKELWTIQQENLYDDMKATEKDAFSDMFFMKSKFAAQRSGNVVMFVFKPEGAIGFELTSGKKLWEYED